MDQLQRFTRYGEKKRGSENKYYEVEANELEDGRGQWTFRWARIGYICKKPKTGTAYSFEAAKSICEAQFEKKGYQEVNAMEALASAVEDLDERKTNGLSNVEVAIPCFHAGKSEERCRRFCQKWLDKLNLVRRSRWDLNARAYEKQIEAVLNGYCAEWKRICGTKSHRALSDNASACTAFRIFFGGLMRNAGISVYGYFEGVPS